MAAGDAGPVIASGARTPIGKLSGALAGVRPVDLGGRAIAAALERAGIAPDEVDYVFMGHVLQAGQGQLTARQAALAAGIPLSTPSTNVNKLCLSGLNAIHLACRMIADGDADVVVAGGMESMTRAPHLVAGAREGFRLGDGVLADSIQVDGLTCAIDHLGMGDATERYAAGSLARERQDAFSAASHERAAAAIKSGALAEEIAPVTIPQRKGDPVLFEIDEGVRPGTTPESLAKLRPAFAPDGTITAGNASQISDGAAAVVVVSRARAESLGVAPLGEILGYGQVAGPSPSLLNQPADAIRAALGRAGLETADMDLFEINEAFAAVALASLDSLGIPDDICNVNGGAIALGHPLGASGTRIALTALYELRRRGGGTAAVGLCGGGGQGDAAILRSLS